MRVRFGFALALAFLLASGVAVAGRINGDGGGGGGGGVSSALVCLLTGGADCTMTGQTIYSGVTTDITTGTNENLTMVANGTGVIALSDSVTATGPIAVGGAISPADASQNTFKNNSAAYDQMVFQNLAATGYVGFDFYNDAGTRQGGMLAGNTAASIPALANVVAVYAATGMDSALYANGAQVVRAASAGIEVDGVASIATTAGTIRGSLFPDTSNAAGLGVKSSSGSGGILKATSGQGLLGRQDDAATTSRAMCATDLMTTTSDGANLFCVNGEGMQEITLRQTISNATATLDTTTPTSSSVDFNCTSGTVCNFEPGETSIRVGEWFDVVNTGSASTVVTTSAGKVKVRGSPLTLAVGDVMHCHYTNSQWSCL